MKHTCNVGYLLMLQVMLPVLSAISIVIISNVIKSIVAVSIMFVMPSIMRPLICADLQSSIKKKQFYTIDYRRFATLSFGILPFRRRQSRKRTNSGSISSKRVARTWLGRGMFWPPSTQVRIAGPWIATRVM